MQILAQIHNNETAVITADGSQPSHPLTVSQPAGGTATAPASQSPPADQVLNPTEDLILTPPPAGENSQATNVTSQPAVEAALETSSGSASAIRF